MHREKGSFLGHVWPMLLGGLLGCLALTGCGGGSSTSGGSSLPQSSTAPVATLEGWVPADTSLSQYRTYTFSASATDANIGGSITEFRWDFGDGSAVQAAPAVLSGGKATSTRSHIYLASGTNTVSVTAKNAAGLSSSAATRALTIQTAACPITATFVSPAAPLTLNAPLAGSVPVTFTVNAANTGTGAISASGVKLDPGDPTATQSAPVSAGSGNWTIAVTYPAAATISNRVVTPSLQVVDADGISSAAVSGPAITIRTVSLTNNPPVVTLTATPALVAGPNATWQNVAIAFKATGTDRDDDALTYTWTFGDGGKGDVAATQAPAALDQTHTYTTAGVYPVTFQADDSRTGGAKSITLNLNILANSKPTLSVAQVPAGQPYANVSLTFTATAPDADGDAPRISWDFGDGSAVVTNQNPVIHTFTAAGVTLVTTTADDLKGGVTSLTTSLTVQANRPPVSQVNTVPASLYQNKPYTFAALATDPDAGDVVARYEWDFGDGTAVQETVTPAATHSYASTFTGIARVKVRALDNHGSTGDFSPSVPFTVLATALPVGTFLNPAGPATYNTESGASGVVITYIVAMTNPNGTGFLPIGALTFDAGEPASTATVLSQTPNGDGTYTYQVRYKPATSVGTRTVVPSVVATDLQGIGGLLKTGGPITINTQALNTPPVITLSTSSTPTAGIHASWQGVEFSFAGTAADADRDPLTYTLAFGDTGGAGDIPSTAVGSGGAISARHTYATPGVYAAVLTVTDGRTSGTKTASINMNVLPNAAPTVTIGKVPTGNAPYANVPITFTATVADANGDATSLVWNFGDGSEPVLNTSSVVHGFAVAGITTVTATADDGKGGVTVASSTLDVQPNRPPVSAITTPGGDLYQSKAYTFSATASDPDTGDTISEFQWDLGDGTAIQSTATGTLTHTYARSFTGLASMKVRAVDNHGSTGDWSPAVGFTVVGTQFPVVTFVTPASAVSLNTEVGAVVGVQRQVTFVVRVTNPNGAAGVYLPVASVAFSANDARATVVSSTDNHDGTYTYVVRYAPALAKDDPAGRTATASVAGVTDGVGVTGVGVSGPVVTIVTQASNQAPVATLVSAPAIKVGGSDVTTYQGVVVTFTGTATDADSDQLTYTWDFGDGTAVVSGTAASLLVQTHTFASAGTFGVKFTAEDSRTSGTKEADLTMNVLVNRGPTLSVVKTTPAGTPTKYQRVEFTATVGDVDGDVPSLSWDFGDGTAVVTATATVQVHQFQAAGVSSVKVTADDGKGGVTVVTVPVTVLENNPPVTLVSGTVSPADAQLYQTKAYTFTASATDPDATDTIASYEWDFGNGTVVSGGSSQSHVFPVTVAGVVQVKARAIDSRGALGAWSPAVGFTVVGTQFPVVTFVTPASAVSLNTEVGAVVGVQRQVTFVVRVTNPNGAAGVYLPVASVAFSANDARATVVSSTDNHDGTYTYVVRYAPALAKDDPAGRTATASVAGVTDGVGVTGVGVSGPVVTIVTQASNQAPVATLVSAPAVAAGTNATWQNVNVVFTGTATDADSDPLTYTWDFDDGTVLTNLTGASALVQTHKFTSAGNYSVKLTVDDGRTGGTKIADLTMNVLANAAPTVSVSKTSPGGNPTKYQRVELSAGDADTDGDARTVTWNFGDGSAAGSGSPVTHQFLAAGLTTVTATADDGKGGVTTGTLVLTVVENNPPVAAVTTAASSLYQTKSYTFTATGSDPDVGDTVASYEWDFGDGTAIQTSTPLTATTTSKSHTFAATFTGVARVKLRAIDSRGAVGDWSPAVNFTVVATSLPVVTFTSPAATTKNIEVSPGTVDQAFTLSVTNPQKASGATDPLPMGNISFLANDALATVLPSPVDHGDGTYTYTVRYTGAATAGTRTATATAQATDSFGIVGLAASGPLMTLTTLGANHAPSITLTSPATDGTVAYTSKVFTLGFTLTDADNDAVAYTVNWGDGTATTTGAPTGDFTAGVAVTATHTYADAFTATSTSVSVTVTATDNRSASATATPRTRLVTVTYNTLPTATITSPQASGSAPTGLPVGITPPYVVVPLNGKLSFAGSPTKPGSQDTIVTTWTFPGGVPSTGTGDAPGEVLFAGTAGVITPRTVTYTVTDALGRAVSATKQVLVDGLNTQAFNLSFLYRLKSDGNGTSSTALVTTAANGLGASVQVFQDGQSSTYAVQNQASLSGAQASVAIPVRSDLPFWVQLPSIGTDTRSYLLRIPNAPTGAYADTSLAATLPVGSSTFGFASASAPWEPTLQLVTAQGFAAETGAAAQRTLTGFTDLYLSTTPSIANERWLDRLSVPTTDATPAITWNQSSNMVGQLSGIAAYQRFAEWPTLLLTRATKDLAEATPDPTAAAGTSSDLGFVLDYETYSATAAASKTFAAFSLQAFRVPAGSTDPYNLSPAWQASTAELNSTSTDPHAGLNPLPVGAGVQTFLSNLVNGAPGSSPLAGGISSLPVPYQPNDPDRVPLSLAATAANVRGYSGIRQVFSYSEYLWSTVWARTLVLNSAQPAYNTALGTFPYFRYSNPTAWPKASGILPSPLSAFDLTVRGGGAFTAAAPVGLAGAAAPATGVGRFFWTAFTPSYEASSGAAIARTWLADDTSKQVPTTFSGTAAGDATVALGFMVPQDTMVDKRGRNADGTLNGNALGGYRVTWYNPTKDANGAPVPPDFWVVELDTGSKKHFMLPGSFPVGTQSVTDAILTDARAYLPSGNAPSVGPAPPVAPATETADRVAPGYCWFDIPLELRPAADATLTVFAVKAVLKNNPIAAARALNRTDWMDAIKTATATLKMQVSGGADLSYAYKVPFNYAWDIVIANGPITTVAP